MTLRCAAPLLLLVFSLPLFAAAPDAELNAFDARITGELEKLNRAAVPLFVKANQEREANQHAAAARDYAAVARMAPSFDHAIRRQAWEEQYLGHHEEAVKLQRTALAMSRSPYNLAALGQLLLDGLSAPPPDSLRSEALGAATEAFRAPDIDASTLTQIGYVALIGNDVDFLEKVVGKMGEVKAPPLTLHYFRAFALGMRGNLSEGRDELDAARAAGLPIEAYRGAMAMFHAARPLWQKIAIWSGWVFVPWLAGLALLFLVGLFLSRAALGASKELPAAENGAPTRFGASLRRVYRAIIGVASVYYYISIPIVIALTLLVVGGVIYACLAAGYMPVQLVVILAFVAIVSVGSMVRGVFRRTKDEDPGEKLDLERHPALRACLDNVANRIGTRPVDSVYLTPGTDVAVFERGKWWRGSRRERCLILGAGVLERFPLRPFKAVLAHEYGHLVNRDTAGGSLAFAVNNTIFRTAVHVAQRGAATWYNPAWQFLRGYHRLFLRISHGASRFQEAMADRWAAFAYGSAAFESGLRHAIVRSVEFPQFANASLSEAVNRKKAVLNLYSFTPEARPPAENLERAIRERLEEVGSAYDSHPPFASRIEWVHALGAAGDPPSPEDDADVWTLFSDREAVERQMTEVVRQNIRQERGIDIAHL